MPMDPRTLTAMSEELTKIAASYSRWKHFRERTGRKPMSIMTMLKKDANGSLFKKHSAPINSMIEFADPDDPASAVRAKDAGDPPSRESQNRDLAQRSLERIRSGLQPLPKPAKKPPSRDDTGSPAVRREDSRDYAQTIQSPGNMTLSDTGPASATDRASL